MFGGLVTAVGLGVATAADRELDANLNAGVLVGYVLFVLLNVATGVTLGALLHNSAAAIVSYFAFPVAFGSAACRPRWADGRRPRPDRAARDQLTDDLQHAKGTAVDNEDPRAVRVLRRTAPTRALLAR